MSEYKVPTATSADVIASWTPELVQARKVARGIPLAHIDLTLANYEAATEQQMLAWAEVQAIEGEGLYLYGGVGTGKTFLSIAWVNSQIMTTMAGAHLMEWKAIVDDQRDKMISRDDPNVGKMLTRAMLCKRLAIDDMGAGKTDSWQVDIMERLLNARWTAQLQTIITSNLTPKELDAKFGDRITTRIRGLCRSVELQGPDQRGLATD